MKISVNKEILPEETIRREMQSWQQRNPGADDATAFEKVSQRMVEWTLIRQEAEKHSMVPPEQVEAGFQALCQQHGGQAAFLKHFGLEAGAVDMVKADVKQHQQSTMFLDGLGKDVPQPDDATVEAYFTEHREQFMQPEKVHAAHIVKHPQDETAEAAAAAELTALRQRLLGGEDFLTVANAASDCNDTPPDLGEFPRGKMVPEFELVVFSMQAGEISPVFKTPFGLHVATVLGRTEPTSMTLEEATPAIRERLLQEARNAAIRTWVEKQKKQAHLEVVPPGVPS